jgi:hypothetical protein
MTNPDNEIRLLDEIWEEILASHGNLAAKLLLAQYREKLWP